MPHILYFVFWTVMGTISAYFAKRKGKNPYLWFILGMTLGLLGLCLIFFLPTRKKVAQRSAATGNHDQDITIDVTPSIPPSYLEKLWFFLTPEKQQFGPMSYSALKDAYNDGKLTKSTYVWNEEMTQWKRYGELFS